MRPGSGLLQDEFIEGATLQCFIGGQWTNSSKIGRFEWPGPLAMGSAIFIGDPLFANVALLIPGSGTPGSTAVLDKSNAARAMVASGGAQIVSDASMFSGVGIGLNGSGAAITGSPVAGLAPGTGNFAIEFAARKTANGVNGFDIVICTYGGTSGATGYWIELSASRGFFFAGGGNSGFSYGMNPNDGVRRTYKVARTDGVLRMWVEGAVVLVATDPTNYPAQTLLIGKNGYNEYFNGVIQALRVTIADGRGTDAYAPSTTPFPESEGSAGVAPLLVRSAVSRTLRVASSALSSHLAPGAIRASTARDVEFGGPGTIYGTTKTKGAPNVPTKARVVLHHQRSKLPVRETWSDPVTGYFEFRGVDTAQQFLALAEDAAGNFRPVAANRLTPEVLA